MGRALMLPPPFLQSFASTFDQTASSQMSYRYMHTLLDKMQSIFPGYKTFPEDRQRNYVLITVETFPAACRVEDFAQDENGRFTPRATLTNVRIDDKRNDQSMIEFFVRGVKHDDVTFAFLYNLKHGGRPRNPMYPLLTCDEGYLLAVEDILLFE